MKASAIFFTVTLASVDIGVEARGVEHGTWTGLRGARFNRRVMETAAPQEAPAAYCDSLACPSNYLPITDARNMACMGGECKVEQCCVLLCSSFACVGAPPIPFADTILCENGACTQEQCCDGGTHQTEEPPTYDDSCSSYKCPTGYATVDDAASKKCKHNPDEDMMPDEGYGIFSYDLDDAAYSYSFGDQAPSYDFSFDYDIDGAPSYGFWFDELDSVKLDTTSIGPSGWHRALKSAKSSLHINSFAETWSTSSSSSEDFCDTPTCCRQLEYGLWGLE